MTIPIAILAGGLATRLHPLSNNLAKSMVPICGKPFIDWQLKLLASSGIERVVLCLGHRANEIQDFVGNGHSYGLTVDYSIEDISLGTAGALHKAKDYLGQCFGVLYGDTYLPIDYLQIISYFRSINSPALLTIYQNSNRYDQSNVNYVKGQIVTYSKKRRTRDMQFIDSGLSIFQSEVLSEIAPDSVIDLSDILETLVAKKQVVGYQIFERFFEVGSFQGIVDLSRHLERHSG
jgi:MurNAc alpha-1-phosphate uridylyltransferase